MSLPQVEILGSGETLNLELVLPKTKPEELLGLWQSRLPADAEILPHGFKFLMKMSDDANDHTLVNVRIQNHKHQGTIVTLTHSFLLDEAELDQMRTHWNQFVSTLGANS